MKEIVHAQNYMYKIMMSTIIHRIILIWGLLLALISITACNNNPYRSSESGENYYYSTFSEPPKHLDPAKSYSSDEYNYIQQIYEPPLQYHFLKRPYELIPLTAKDMPTVEYFDEDGNTLPDDAPSEKVAKAVYTVRIKSGIMYQNHPCFAKDEQGNPLYMNLKEEEMEEIESVNDFPVKGTRELTADDYVWQIKRLAHPLLECPILSTMEKYIDGMKELSQELQEELKRIRSERKEKGGPLYNQELDEKRNPIFIDLDKFPFKGAKAVDRYTYQIVLKKKYPQMLYWLAMPFFVPVPKEADQFYAQGPLLERNIKLDNSPVGTGAYKMQVFASNREIILTRNENYHGEKYPTKGEPEDVEVGLLRDASKPLPFIEKAIYKLEKEAIPRWNKFLQGYYDASGIGSDVFDQAVTFSSAGLALTDDMKEKGIKLMTSVHPTIFYFAFNMLDDVVGGYTPEKKKLRQAISVAIDAEEFIQIFRNGRDIPAHSPIPPGIFGHKSGKEGMNPYVYNWDEEANKPRRKSTESAKRLLAEAGYPGGRDKDGNPLVVYYDTVSWGAGNKQFFDWMRKQFDKIGVDLQIRATDYNRFRDKTLNGNFQILSWGWHADYPDPENFLFLLYGPNSKAKFGGENAANYDNSEYDRLFEKMENMYNGPQRLKIIRKMVKIVQQDCPWIYRFFLVDYTLYHQWYFNAKPLTIGGGTLKYRRIDSERREDIRQKWNKPIWWPIIVFFLIVLISSIPAIRTVRKRQKRRALS